MCSRVWAVMMMVVAIRLQTLMVNMHMRRPHRLLTMLPRMMPKPKPM